MRPHYRDDRVTLYHGNCLDVLRTLPAESVESVVTDPPYALDFMGSHWDRFSPAAFQQWCTEWATECARILKPGGYLIAFGGTRTWHRLAAGIEDAGLEIRDSIAWLYASGMPKSLNVAGAIDRVRHDREDVLRVTAWIAGARDAAGINNRTIDDAFGTNGMAGHWTSQKSQPAVPTLDQVPKLLDVLGVADDQVPAEIRRLLVDLNGRKGEPGEAWQQAEVVGITEGAASGWNMDGSTKYVDREQKAPNSPAARKWAGWGTALKPSFEPVVVARKALVGTVAQNVTDHGVGALNIDACRIPTDDDLGGGANTGTTSDTRHPGWARPWMDDEQAREAAAERSRAATAHAQELGRWPANALLDEPAGQALDSTPGAPGIARFWPVFKYEPKAPPSERPKVNGVQHPTVKPLDLMRWLVRLVTPAGGTVLEPFAGSGTTAEACVHEYLQCVAIEREADYLPIIEARLTKPMQVGFDLGI